MNNDQALQLVSRALTAWLGTLFTYSGALKLCLYRQAVQYLEPYTILPETVFRPARYLLPWIEFATGILLLGGCYPWGQASSLALSSSFVWATISGVRRRLHAPCGCDPLGKEYLGRQTVLRAVLLLGSSILCLVAGRTRTQLPSGIASLLLGLSVLPSLLIQRYSRLDR